LFKDQLAIVFLRNPGSEGSFSCSDVPFNRNKIILHQIV